MRLTISAAVANREVGSAGRNVFDQVEVVHAIFVGNILLTTQNVDDGRVNILQFRFVRHRHVANGLSAIAVLEESAVTDHQSLDARVGTVVQRLQTAA